jgi:hypothetical protein
MERTDRLAAECLGTFVLVFGGCGSAVLAAAFPDLGIGFLGVALAFGLTVLTMVYAVGHVSGGHFNPAVTVGLAAARRFSWRDVAPYPPDRDPGHERLGEPGAEHGARPLRRRVGAGAALALLGGAAARRAAGQRRVRRGGRGAGPVVTRAAAALDDGVVAAG